MVSSNSLSRKYILDTNFFISGFEKNPSEFNDFLKIIKRMNIGLFVTNQILQEIRWYLRRRIKDPVRILKISMKEMRTLKEDLANNNKSSPHLFDLSNIIAAKQINGTVVSSDLKLVKTCEKLKVPTMISSSFVFFLKSISIREEDKTLLEGLYDTILSDEIKHSVEKSQIYDPVARIKKIQEHAINVLQNIIDSSVQPQKEKFEEYYILDEENILIEIMNEIEFEFPNYLQQLKKGELEGLKSELEEVYRFLSDSSMNLRIALLEKKSYAEELAIRLKARIVYLLSIVTFTLLDFEKLEGYLNIITEISTSFPKLVSDIFMDIHFLRMVYFLVTNNHERLKGYYSEKFLFLCEKQERTDLMRLTRVVILASTIMESGMVDKKAIIDGQDENSLLVQIGYILLQKKQFEHALLILLQAYYIAINLKDRVLAQDSLELLTILYYSVKEKFSEEIYRGIEDLKKLGIYELPVITYSSRNELQRFVTEAYVSLEEVPSILQDWFYVYHSGRVYKAGEEYTFILLKNPYYSPRIALLLKSQVSSFDITPGRQIKILEGKVSVTIPKDPIIDGYPIDLEINVEGKGGKFIFRGPFGMKIIL